MGKRKFVTLKEVDAPRELEGWIRTVSGMPRDLLI
jgi:hypothetical protein